MPQPVGTLVKAMKILDALGAGGPVRVLELSRQLKLDKSAVSRILTTFKARDYVRINKDGRYDLGLRLFELGQTLQERMPFREMVIPHVDAIARETGETVFAVHFSQGLIAYLYDRASSHDIRLSEHAGIRSSPWKHPAGKAIFALSEDSEVLSVLTNAREAGNQNLPAAEDFSQELAQVRQQGYAQQRDEEKCLIAAAVPGMPYPFGVALMVGGPTFRMDASRTEPLANLLIEHASEVSRTLMRMSKTLVNIPN